MKRVLFVDDEPQILQGLKSMLYRRRGDWDMQFAEGGSPAVERIASEGFDAVVTDLRMPRVDGAAVLRSAREHSPQAIRIVLSGASDDQQRIRLIALAQQYLSKPCEPARLEGIIDRCFATQNLIASEQIRARLGGANALPAVPATFAKLQAVLADDRADMKAVARVIESDPAIVAKVLQIVNSAFFRLPKKVSTVEQAVTYLGASAIRNLTLAAELFQRSTPLPRGIDPVELHDHALRVGRLARMVAQGTAFADDAFLAGLVHNVGLLLLGDAFPEEMRGVMDGAMSGEPLIEAERRCVGIDHATAGGYLLGIWGLSYEVIEAVAHHHVPIAVKSDALDVMSSLAIAQGLLAQLDPAHIPVLERTQGCVGADYLQAIGLASSWDELLEKAQLLLEST